MCFMFEKNPKEVCSTSLVINPYLAFFQDIIAFVVGRVTEAGINNNLFLLQNKAVRWLVSIL